MQTHSANYFFLICVRVDNSCLQRKLASHTGVNRSRDMFDNFFYLHFFFFFFFFFFFL